MTPRAWLLLLAACSGPPAELVTVEPTRVDFGPVGVGLSARADLLVLAVEDFLLRADADEAIAEAFDVLPRHDLVLRDEPTPMSLRFSPTREGQWSGELRLVDFYDRSQVLAVVPVTGTGRPGGLRATPIPLDFGRVRVGASKRLSLVIENPEETPSQLAVVGPELGSSDAFSFELPQIEPLLPSGGRFELPVSFAPTGEGRFEASWGFGTGARAQATLAVALVGDGVAAGFAVEPESVDFGSVAVSGSSTRTLRVRSITDQPLRIEARIAGALDLQLDRYELSLAPGEEQDLELTFSPSRESVVQASVVLDGGSEGQRQVLVSATARPATVERPSLPEDRLDFGPTTVGAETRRFAWAELPAGEELSIQGDSSFAVLPSSSSPGRRRVELRFRPSRLGAIEATLLAGTATRALGGLGVAQAAAAVEAWPPVLEFGPVPRGTTGLRRFTLRSVGSAPVAELAVEADPPFWLLGPAPARLEAQDEVDVWVAFPGDDRPSGRRRGELRVSAGARLFASVSLEAEVHRAVEPPPALEVRLAWAEPTNLDLHLLRPGGLAFEPPGDACFCNPQPDWGLAGASDDDPWLDADHPVGPAEERIRLQGVSEVSYRIEVVNGGPLPADAEVEVRASGARLGALRRRLPPGSRWAAGTVELAAAPSFRAENGPLLVENRRFCD